MVDQGSDGEEEEGGGKTEGGEEKEHRVESETGRGEEKAKEGDTHRAEGNKAVFDFAAGEVACREAAQSDADGDCGLQQAAVSCGDEEDVARIEDDVELQQRAEEEEVGISEDCQQQHAVLADEFALRPQIAQEIGTELFRGVGGRNFRDAKAGCESDY